MVHNINYQQRNEKEYHKRSSEQDNVKGYSESNHPYPANKDKRTNKDKRKKENNVRSTTQPTIIKVSNKYTRTCIKLAIEMHICISVNSLNIYTLKH